MAVKSVPAEKETTLRLKVAGKVEKGEKAVFHIHKVDDDSEIDSVEGEVKKGLATCKWTAQGPDADGDERSWRVYYKAEVGELETKSEELVVYHDKVELSSVAEDGSALPDMPYELQVKNDKGKALLKRPRRGTTESGARVEVQGLPPGELEITWRSPARLVSWEEETATKRKAKLKPAFRAKLAWPSSDEPKEEDRVYEQLVNHKPHKDHPEYGSKLKVRVGCHEDDGPARKGDVIYVKAEYGADNSKRKTPKPAIAGGKKYDWADHGKVIKVTKDDGEASFTLELGMAGRDEVTLRVGGTDACEDDSITITNWRKLYYQVTHRKGQAKPAMTRMTTTLEEVGVRYEETKTVEFAEGDKGVPKGTFLDGAMVSRAGRVVNIGDHNKQYFHTKLFENTKKPLGVHVLFCDVQFDGGSKKHHTQVHGVKMDSDTVKVPMKSRSHHIFEKALQDEGSPLVEGAWKSTAPKGHPHHGKKGKLTDAEVRIDHASAPVSFEIVLPSVDADDPGSLAGPGDGKSKDPAVKHPVLAAVKVKFCYGEYLGEADGKFGYWQLIAVNAVSSTNDIMSHELGHTMNAVLGGALPPGLKKKDHTRRYTGHGHTGPHCADGMSQGDFDSLADYGGDARCKCIMYGENSGSGSLSSGSFCDQCKPFIKAERLTTL